MAEAIKAAIVSGRLAPGALLPGSRILSEMLAVNRQTVINAIQFLESEGWVHTEVYRGTFVVRDLPSGARSVPKDQADPPGSALGFDLPSLLKPVSISTTGALLLADGAPDPRLAPGDSIAKGYHRAMQRHGPTLLQDRDPLGAPLLREQLAEWISERHGVRVDQGRIVITRGSRSAIALLAHSLLREGEAALVETPGNRAAWEILHASAKMRIVGVRQAGGKLNLEGVRSQFSGGRIRIFYISARRQFPTGASMEPAEAEALLALAAEYRVAILEDDYDAEFNFSEPRPTPLVALDREGLVIHMSSLSRLIAPGIRISYLVVPALLAPFLAKVKQQLDESGDAALEWAIGDLIRDGELARHVRRTRKIYQHRRDFLVSLLQDRLGEDLDFDVPTGGMGIWLKMRQGIDADTWVMKARARGLKLNLPSWFYLEDPSPCFRMGFAQADESELELAVEHLVESRVHRK